jgi:predicted RNA-binding protein with PIN domain
VVVDGYNLILRTPALRPGEGRTLRQSRNKLLSLLAWAVDPGAHFIVVFDGAEVRGRDARQGRVEVRYSKPPEKADDLIRSLVADRIERTDGLTVVTSDLEVARHARALGADVSLADLFVASLLGPGTGSEAEKPSTLSKKEIEEWAEIFRRRGTPSPGEDPGGG